MDEKIVSDCAKKTFPLPANGSFFDFAPDSPAEKGTKNLLLLTLSTISPNPRKGIAMLSTDQTEVPEEYYYQLEPVPYMLMHQFAEKNNGEKLDGILMICSPATLDDTVELTDPRYGDFKDTARNYFAFITSTFAQKHQSPLSYKEICTNFGSKETDPVKRAEEHSENSRQFIHDVIEEIRLLKNHYPDLNILVDTHGGFRTAQEILNTVLSLLQMENIEIKPEHIYNVEFQPVNGVSRAYFTSSAEIFDIINFVSGIHECINYGQIKSLDQSMKNFKGEIEQKVLDSMRTTAEGIQLCDVNKFESGLSNLSDSLKKLGGTPASLDNSSYLRLFQDLIRDSYGDELLDNSKRKTINEIKWCIEKDFIQQALTLVESKMPKEIIEHNFLYCKELFDVTPSGTIIKKSEKEHLNDDNSPKQRWESVENYIFQKFGWTKKDKNKTFFLNLSEIDDLDKIEYYRGYPNCYINPPKKDTAWESRCYRISEHQKEKKDINVLVRLHMELKQIRNQANHAGEDDNRYSIDTVRKALKAYVELYEKIERKLHR